MPVFFDMIFSHDYCNNDIVYNLKKNNTNMSIVQKFVQQTTKICITHHTKMTIDTNDCHNIFNMKYL